MRVSALSAVLICLTACGPLYAQAGIGEGTTVDFATVDEAKQILTRRDEFVDRMSPFDRCSRMKTDADVPEEAFLEFAGENALPWNAVEKEKLTTALEGVRTQLAALSLPLPNRILLIKTTGKEEGGALYTRSNAVVFPEKELTRSVPDIQKRICHELFHILSRQDPTLRQKLYATIGFVQCDEVALPGPLKSRKITNPDAPWNAYCIRLVVEGEEHWAIPILFSRTEKYDVKRGGEFFDYLQFRFLLVERDGQSRAVKPRYDGQSPRLVRIDEVSGFSEQIGENTTYIIHPEEILADNFALLVLGERHLRSPEIVGRLRQVLEECAGAGLSR